MHSHKKNTHTEPEDTAEAAAGALNHMIRYTRTKGQAVKTTSKAQQS